MQFQVGEARLHAEHTAVETGTDSAIPVGLGDLPDRQMMVVHRVVDEDVYLAEGLRDAVTALKTSAREVTSQRIANWTPRAVTRPAVSLIVASILPNRRYADRDSRAPT